MTKCYDAHFFIIILPVINFVLLNYKVAFVKNASVVIQLSFQPTWGIVTRLYFVSTAFAIKECQISNRITYTEFIYNERLPMSIMFAKFCYNLILKDILATIIQFQ